jgi:hypothetical protein
MYHPKQESKPMFDDRIPECRPFFVACRKLKQEFMDDIDALRRSIAHPRPGCSIKLLMQSHKEATQDYTSIIETLNGNFDKMNDRVLTGLRKFTDQLPKETLEWCRKNGIML